MKSIRKNYWSFSNREKLSTPGVLSKLSKCIISPQTHSQKYELVLLGNKRKTCFDDPVKSLLCTVEVISPELIIIIIKLLIERLSSPVLSALHKY